MDLIHWEYEHFPQHLVSNASSVQLASLDVHETNVIHTIVDYPVPKFTWNGYRCLPRTRMCTDVQSGDEFLGELEGVVFGDESAGKKKEKWKKGQLVEATTDNFV
jgi:hypothetical protein